MKNLLDDDKYMKAFFIVCLIFGIGMAIYGAVLAASSKYGVLVTSIGVASLLIGNIAHVRYTRRRLGVD